MLHGRYRIDKLLAIGGFSAVYLAGDLQNAGKAVAVKDMICNEPQEFQVRLAFFQREAEILKALARLPTVPRFYGFYREGKGAQLVLEYIAGQDLLRMLESNNNAPFPFEQVIGWGKEVCDVLTHMHSQSPPIVHRDIKPENIMLLREQNSIRMIDFGTARDIGRSAGNKPAAMTRVYTEGYAAPEQILGKPEARSDLFALAGTLYHLATGKAPDFQTARELERELKAPTVPWPEERRWFLNYCASTWPKISVSVISRAANSKRTWKNARLHGRRLAPSANRVTRCVSLTAANVPLHSPILRLLANSVVRTIVRGAGGAFTADTGYRKCPKQGINDQ